VWAETGLPAALDHFALRAPAVAGLLLLRAGLANPIVDRQTCERPNWRADGYRGGTANLRGLIFGFTVQPLSRSSSTVAPSTVIVMRLGHLTPLSVR
jgi:hypothetical protein